MKILVLSDLWLPFPGGAERLMFNVARTLLGRGHDMVVLTGYEHPQQFDGPPVVSAPIGVFANRDAGARIVGDMLDSFEPDVILTHHLYAYEFETLLTAHKPPMLVQLVLNTRRLARADLAVFISRFALRNVDGGLQGGDMIITPPAFDDVIADGHGEAIGFIKPIEHKGVDLVYDIAQRMPDRQFVVLRGEWQTLEVMPDPPLANVTFLEPVDDIRDFYKLVRVVLMPSISEDAGTVAQECALNRIPCISSNVGGLRETNVGGIRITERSPERYVRAIVSLDVPRRYDDVVARQTRKFNETRQEVRMSMLAERIEGLVP